MSLNNILPPSRQICNSSGNPLSGGKVFLFEPGTTTFVTSYQDSGLVTPNANPVRLSGSGRANIWITRDVDVYITDRYSGDLVPTNIVVTELNANPDALGGDESGGLVPNGSFETDNDSDTVPDSWTLASESGSTNAIDTSYSTDGAQSFRFTSSGAGGGSLVTDDFFPVNDVDQLRVNVDLYSSVAGVHNIVRVEWYDVSQVFISNSDAYDSTSNPTSWTSQNLVATPPSGARFAKLRLIGCDPDTAVAGSTWFDRLSVFYPAIVSGVFDNITIQDNQIITTNTNGDLEIGPNGTGAVNINGGAAVDLSDAKNPMNVGLTNAPASNAHIAFDQNKIQAKTDATTAAALSINSLGGTLNLGAQSGTGDVWLRHNGNHRIVTAANFVHVHSDGTGDPTTPDNQSLGFNLFSSDNNQYGQIGFNGSPNLQLYNLAHGGAINFLGEDSSGNIRTMLQCDPDGAVYLAYGANNRLNTNASGLLNLTSDGNTDTEGRVLIFAHANGTSRGLVGHNGGSDIILQNAIHGGATILSAEDTGGTARNLVVGDPDDDVKLYDVGVEVARTLPAASGGFQINNTSTGTGFERALSASDIPWMSTQVVSKSADTTRASTTTMTADPHLTISNLAAGDYMVEVYLLTQNTASATAGIRVGLAFSGSVNDYRGYVGIGEDPSGNSLVQDEYFTSTPNPISFKSLQSTVAANMIRLSGFFDANSIGNLELVWAQAVSETDGTTLLSRSRMVVTRVG